MWQKCSFDQTDGTFETGAYNSIAPMKMGGTLVETENDHRKKKLYGGICRFF